MFYWWFLPVAFGLVSSGNDDVFTLPAIINDFVMTHPKHHPRRSFLRSNKSGLSNDASNLFKVYDIVATQVPDIFESSDADNSQPALTEPAPAESVFLHEVSTQENLDSLDKQSTQNDLDEISTPSTEDTFVVTPTILGATGGAVGLVGVVACTSFSMKKRAPSSSFEPEESASLSVCGSESILGADLDEFLN